MNLETIYREGEQHYFSNNGVYVNPYNNGSTEFNEFERGWTQALKRTNGSLINSTSIGSKLSNEKLSKTLSTENIKIEATLYRKRKG